MYGFPYYYDQDGSGKLSKAFSYGYSWRYTPQHDASETYASANALDQVGSITGNLHMPIIGYMASPPASETRTLDYDGNGSVTTDGNGRTYTYNSENQMVEAVGTAPGDMFHVSYLYDGPLVR